MKTKFTEAQKEILIEALTYYLHDATTEEHGYAGLTGRRAKTLELAISKLNEVLK